MNIQAITSAAYGTKVTDLRRAADNRPTVPSPASSERAGEKVEFSDTSNELSMLKGVIDALPEVRIELVEEIQARIAINDYPIKSRLDDALKQMMLSGVLKS